MATKIIKAWIDGAVREIEVEDMVSPEMEPSIEERVSALENKAVSTDATVTLLASAWEGVEVPYSQVVIIDGVTANTRVDPTPTATQIVEMQDEDIAFVFENEDGIVTAYSVNGKPEIDYEIKVALTEVTSV